MTYQEFAQTFTSRMQTALNNLKSNLVVAGIQANRVVVEEITTDVDTSDLRWRISATRGAKDFALYVEMTAAGVIDNQMAITLTLYCEANGVFVGTSYTPNAPVKYTDDVALDGLLGTILTLENTLSGEVLTDMRAHLGV